DVRVRASRRSLRVDANDPARWNRLQSSERARRVLWEERVLLVEIIGFDPPGGDGDFDDRVVVGPVKRPGVHHGALDRVEQEDMGEAASSIVKAEDSLLPRKNATTKNIRDTLDRRRVEDDHVDPSRLDSSWARRRAASLRGSG